MIEKLTQQFVPKNSLPKRLIFRNGGRNQEAAMTSFALVNILVLGMS
jgi:hypothetical protein